MGALSFTFNGVTSDSHGLIVTNLPQPSVAEKNATVFTIPGRPGDLTIMERGHKTIIKTVNALIPKTANISNIFAWLQGTGSLAFSDRLSRLYTAEILQPVLTELDSATLWSISIPFKCQPYGYLYPAASNIVLTSSPATVDNPGTVYSAPAIAVTGTGTVTLTVNSQVITLTDLGTNESITMDSEALIARTGTVNKNAKMSGPFPILNPGNNTISWTGTVASVNIAPRWRYLD